MVHYVLSSRVRPISLFSYRPILINQFFLLANTDTETDKFLFHIGRYRYDGFCEKGIGQDKCCKLKSFTCVIGPSPGTILPIYFVPYSLRTG